MTTNAATASRRGRPPSTNLRDVEVIALRLFTERGFDDTTMDDIAAAAGVSRRTLFRYFDSKADILWHSFDDEVERLRTSFAAVPARTALMTAIRQVVVGVNHYSASDAVELHQRIQLINSAPALQASAALHYDAWERCVCEFAAARLDAPPNSLVPLAIGRATLAACRAAYEVWVTRADADLTVYLDQALRALSRGFK